MYGHPPFRHVHYSVFRVTLSIFASSKKLFFEIQILTEHKESLIGLMMDCHHSELMGESSSFARLDVSVCTGHISNACSASVHHPAVAFIKRAFLPSTCVARSPASSPEWTAFPFPPFLLSSGGQLFDISTPFVSASVSLTLCRLYCVRSVSLSVLPSPSAMSKFSIFCFVKSSLSALRDLMKIWEAEKLASGGTRSGHTVKQFEVAMRRCLWFSLNREDEKLKW